jgi:hypothetical protein
MRNKEKNSGVARSLYRGPDVDAGFEIVWTQWLNIRERKLTQKVTYFLDQLAVHSTVPMGLVRADHLLGRVCTEAVGNKLAMWPGLSARLQPGTLGVLDNLDLANEQWRQPRSAVRFTAGHGHQYHRGVPVPKLSILSNRLFDEVSGLFRERYRARVVEVPRE